MVLNKNLLNQGFATKHVEKHFHDHDETWIVLAGMAKAFEIDRQGKRQEHVLEPGDIWMIEVGHEHGCEALTPDFKIAVLHGTMAPGSHKPGHYYMEREKYIPSLELRKEPTDRYDRSV